MTYKSREYCKDIDCKWQRCIDRCPTDKDKSIFKEECHKCDAYNFHQWLIKHNYVITKGDFEMDFEEKFEEVRKQYNEAIDRKKMELAADLGKELKFLNKMKNRELYKEMLGC